MVLDSFTNSGVLKAKTAFDKAARRNREVAIVTMLCLSYDAFHKMQLYRICSDSNLSYQEAESQSEMFSNVFGVDIPTEAFLPNKDKFSNMAIHSYNEYKKSRRLLTSIGYSESDVESFCKMVFYNPEQYDLCFFRALNSAGYAVSMVGIFDYVCGVCSLEQLSNVMVILEPSGMKPMNQTQIKEFVKTMFKVLDAFYDIVQLRRSRQ